MVDPKDLHLARETEPCVHCGIPTTWRIGLERIPMCPLHADLGKPEAKEKEE